MAAKEDRIALMEFTRFLEEHAGLPLEAQRTLVLDLFARGRGPGKSLAFTDASTDPRFRWIESDLLEEDTSWAIHGDELNLDLLKESVTVAGGLYFLLEDPLAIVGGLVTLLYKYRKKRARLSGNQGIVLRTLKKAPESGWTPAELWIQLPLKKGNGMTKENVRAILKELQSVRLEDGTQTALVDQKKGHWWSVDV